MSGGQLLEIRLLDNHLLDTFGRKSTARHKIYQLLESSKCLLNWIRADDKKLSIARIQFKIAVDHYFLLIILQKLLEFNLLDTFCS
jgi:hypothetical protein